MTRPRNTQNRLKRLSLCLALTLLSDRPAQASGEPAGHALLAAQVSESRGLLNLGSSLTERGDFDGAEIAFRQVLSEANAAPADTKSALLGLAHMHRKQGALTKAAAIYEKFLQEYPGDDRSPDALLELGRTLRSMGAYKMAITRFYSVINSTLKLPAEGFKHYEQLAKTAQFEIAETHFQAGEYEEAGKFFSRLSLLDLAPSDQAYAHFMAACSLDQQGNREGAVSMLRAFLEQWPDDENVPEARYLLATNLHALNRTQEALAATLELLRSEKSRVSGNTKRWSYWQRRTGNKLANDLFESGDINDAQAIYVGLASLSDDPSWQLPVTYQVALCDERLGDLDRARGAYQKIISGSSSSASPDLASLAQLATWRLAQLDWHDNMTHQVTTLMVTRTGRMAQAAPTTPPPIQ
jgi:tetratricopeptide (TPR) repeat protein